MATVYADLSASTSGSGTQGSPYTAAQISTFVKTGGGIASGDTIRVKGSNTAAGDSTIFQSIAESCTIEGWGDGAPWYLNVGGATNDAYLNILTSDVARTVNVQDMVAYRCYTSAPGTGGVVHTFRFRNCMFCTQGNQGVNGRAHGVYSSADSEINVYYYGCTFNGNGGTGGEYGIIGYQAVLCAHTNEMFIDDCWFDMRGTVSAGASCRLDPSGANGWGEATIVNSYTRGPDDIVALNSTVTGSFNVSFITFRRLPSVTAGVCPTLTTGNVAYTKYGLPGLSPVPSRWDTNSYDDGFWLSTRSGIGAFYFDAQLARKTLRYAYERSQGVGWSEYNGDAWPFPCALQAIWPYVDTNGVFRNVVVTECEIAGATDYEDFEVGTYDVTRASRPVPLDQQNGDTDTANTEIVWEWWEASRDAGPQDAEKKMEHAESHYFVEPRYPEDKGIGGYDSNGFRDAQQLDCDVYVDGSVTTLRARTDDIPKDGDMVFSGDKLEARQLQFVFKGAAGECVIKGCRHDFIAKPKAGSRTERTMGDHTSQLTLASPEYWVVRGNTYGPLREQMAGATLTGTGATTTGADGRDDSGYTLTAALTLANAAIAADYTIIFFSSAGVTVTAGALTQYGDTFRTTWGLYYIQGAGGIAANQVIGAGDIFDIRIYSSQLSTTDMKVLYDDVRYNEGRGLLPIF